MRNMALIDMYLQSRGVEEMRVQRMSDGSYDLDVGVNFRLANLSQEQLEELREQIDLAIGKEADHASAKTAS